MPWICGQGCDPLDVLVSFLRCGRKTENFQANFKGKTGSFRFIFSCKGKQAVSNWYHAGCLAPFSLMKCEEGLGEKLYFLFSFFFSSAMCLLDDWSILNPKKESVFQEKQK